MFTIVLHTPKGGSGKSTLAREIAAMSAKSGVRTAVADLDPQGTTEGWYRRRENPDPSLVAFKPERMRSQMKALSEAEFGLFVIDTPPAQPAYIGELLTLADLVLVPVRPTPDDLLAAAPIARSLARHADWAFVLSQVPPRTRLLSSAVRQLAAIGRVAPVQFTFRADYPAAAIDGSAAAELTGKAADEAAQVYAWITSRMDVSMAKRPDLDSLIVPKGEASLPPAETALAGDGSVSRGYAHTLSYRMTAEQYRRLRRFVADQEEKTGKRVTHQAIIEAAVDDWLKRAGA